MLRSLRTPAKIAEVSMLRSTKLKRMRRMRSIWISMTRRAKRSVTMKRRSTSKDSTLKTRPFLNFSKATRNLSEEEEGEEARK